MDPFTLGFLGISAAGGTLFIVGLLQRNGITINETAIKLLLETVKFGGIFYLITKLTAFL